ncbi:Putative aspartic protease [Glycine soja]|nr:Putative aspartic protease [Glycine soja]
MSPFHNPTETHFNQLSNAIHRSFNRVNHFYPKTKSSRQKTPQSVITSSQGEYLVKYSIGTPPFDAMGIADTGSDLIWSQCKPCQQCYNQTTPLFDPSKSATYEPVSCYSSMCNSLGQSYCYSDTEPNCEYTVSYGDGSHSQGNLALDTITLGSSTGSSVSFPKIPIGCGLNNAGTFDSKCFGIVGLGGGVVSLISHIGTTLTILLEKFYTKLEAEVEAHINLERVNSTDQILSLCYKSPPNNAIEVPIITAHFAGTDIVLNSLNTFVSVSDDAMCFAFAPVASGSIFGNLAQMNHLVGYDLLRKTIKKANPEAEFKEISTMVIAKEKLETESMSLLEDEQKQRTAMELLEQYMQFKQEAEKDGKKNKKEKDPLKPKHPIPPNLSQKNDDLEPVHRWIVVKFEYNVCNTIPSILTIGNFDIMSELRETPFAL